MDTLNLLYIYYNNLSLQLGSEFDEIGLRGETVSVLGTGDFGRALGSRLVQAGYGVVFGSRDPKRNA